LRISPLKAQATSASETPAAPNSTLASLTIVGFWLVVVLLMSTQSYVGWNREGYDVTRLQVAILEGTRWGLWIFITFWILWLMKKLPIQRDRWRSRLLLHLLLSGLVCLLHFAIDTKMQQIVEPWPLGTDSFFELLRNRLGSVRVHLSIVVYWAILGMTHAIDYYRKYHAGELRSQQLRTQLAQAQLQALKMQLHPHFLFNTLNSIAALVRNKQYRAATDMLAGLSDLLRLVLENAGAQEVSLKQELEFLERYLEIEQTRFEDRLQVHMKIQPETLDGRIPNLILQPLVENAIRHGIATNPDSGSIEVSSTKVNGALQVEIRNTCAGIETPDFDGHDGLGLSNTRERLDMLYGHDQKLEITHVTGEGTRVCLTIPFQPIKAEDED
jgi:signal transduction histidine kinase